jgi:hypothetical protein
VFPLLFSGIEFDTELSDTHEKMTTKHKISSTVPADNAREKKVSIHLDEDHHIKNASQQIA